jgi:hypothetical protein
LPRWPAASGIHAFHGEVRALDDPDLDRGTAGRAPLGGPRGEALQGGERVGQVGLQHDPRFQLSQLRLFEDALEYLDGQVEVAELLHVEVDEFGRRGRRGQLIERGEACDDAVDGLVVSPHRQLADDRGDLDRDVVDVGALEECARSREPAVGLVVAEHRLAEQVEVEAGSLAAQLREGGVEVGRGGVDDEVADHSAKHPPGDGHDQPGELGRETAAKGDRHTLVERQERGDAAAEQLQVAGGDAHVLGTYDAVDEPEREVEALGVFQYPGEPFRAFIGRGGRRFGEPAPHGRDRFVGEVVGHRSGIRLLR